MFFCCMSYVYPDLSSKHCNLCHSFQCWIDRCLSFVALQPLFWYLCQWFWINTLLSGCHSKGPKTDTWTLLNPGNSSLYLPVYESDEINKAFRHWKIRIKIHWSSVPVGQKIFHKHCSFSFCMPESYLGSVSLYSIEQIISLVRRSSATFFFQWLEISIK